MRAVFPMFVFALAACGPTTATPPPAAPAAAEAPAPATLTGQFIAISNTAMSITGDLDLQANVLQFSKGFRVEGGRIDSALTADTDLSAGSGTIASGSGNTSVQTIELRKIDLVRVAADARAPQLCGEGATVSHVILAQGAQTLSVLVFSGADAPGPDAHDTQLCGIFNYAPSAS